MWVLGNIRSRVNSWRAKSLLIPCSFRSRICCCRWWGPTSLAAEEEDCDDRNEKDGSTADSDTRNATATEPA